MPTLPQNSLIYGKIGKIGSAHFSSVLWPTPTHFSTDFFTKGVKMLSTISRFI